MLENDVINEQPAPTPKRARSRRLDAGTVFVAALVFAAGAGLYYMHWRTADALKLISNATADAASVDTLLSGGRANLATLGKAIRQTQSTVAQLTKTRAPVPASTLFESRDPFAFESLEPEVSKPTAAPSNGAREQTKSKLLTQARTLQVQSIMFGSAKRSCLINGKLYFEGQPCGEFVVDTITQSSVFVQSGEFRFELRFRK